MANKLINDDCFNIMPKIKDKAIDMILCDLPYGTTSNKWDSVLPLDKLWTEYKRIIKPNGAIVLTAQIPFSIVLGASNLNMLKYEWIWEKEHGTGIFNANHAPLKNHENVLVFYNNVPTYNPQKYTMGNKGKRYTAKQGHTGTNYGKGSTGQITKSDGFRLPNTIIFFSRDKNKLHPTQKPVKLFEYLIKTYTNEGDIVLDNCAGSGTTAIAAINTRRKYIAIEFDKEIYQIAKNRIEHNNKQKNNTLDSFF